jgi:adenylate kinase family enzyme
MVVERSRLGIWREAEVERGAVDPRSMRRIVIVGTYGAGKTTLAAKLGSLLGLEVHHLDALRWLPGWQLRPFDEWLTISGRLVENDAWILDGNFEHTLELRLRRADTVIVLDFPTFLSLRRVGLRRLRRGTRPDLAPGLDERLNVRFLRLAFGYRRRVRPVILELVERYRDGRQLLVLRGPRDVSALLESVRRAAAVPAESA